MLVIGINGVIGSGKSTLANALLNRLPNSRLEAFAYPLKRFCMDMLGLSYEQCYGTQEKNSLTKYKYYEIEPYSSSTSLMPARKVMQYYGQYFRWINEDFFVDKFLARTEWAVTTNAIFLIEDLRHRNEAKICDYTFRCIGDSTDSHISENDLKDHPFDLYVDKTKQTPIEAADAVVEYLRLNADSKYFN